MPAEKSNARTPPFANESLETAKYRRFEVQISRKATRQNQRNQSAIVESIHSETLPDPDPGALGALAARGGGLALLQLRMANHLLEVDDFVHTTLTP